MKKPKIIKNFLKENELKSLNSWTLNNYKNPYFVDPKMNNDAVQTRYTTRHAHLRSCEYKDYMVEYPKEVYEIQKRLVEVLKLKRSLLIPFPSFTNGICTTLAFSPGSCSSHVDPIYYHDMYTLHCNFVTQNPIKGGITIVEGKKYDIAENDLILYVSSHMEHEVTECYGDVPRILWVFGFCISECKKNEIFKDMTYH